MGLKKTRGLKFAWLEKLEIKGVVHCKKIESLKFSISEISSSKVVHYDATGADSLEFYNEEV